MTPEETQYIDQMTSHMKPHCVGRYVINLPESFVLNSETNAEIEGVKVNVIPMSKVKFESYFGYRKQQLESAVLPGAGGRSLVKSVYALHGGAEGAVFDRAASANSSDRMNRVLELISWKDGYLVKAQVTATDTTFPEDANDSVAKQLHTDTPQKLAHLLKVYERVRGRGQGEIPAEQGLCIANGFVAGPPVVDEGVQIAFDLKGTPDVYFNFTEDGTLHEKTTLLQRSSQVESEMSQSGTQTVRKGQRTIDGHPYEEWLMKGPTPAQVAGTMFTLHGNEVAEGAAKPFVSLVLYNGFRVLQPAGLTLEQQEQRGLFKDLKKATLSEAEAVALWDKVTATLRPRPGAF
jgi:hypothetical protein